MGGTAHKEEAREFMAEAIAMARANIRLGGGPFAALVVKGGSIVARGVNLVASMNDPTAHAEVIAIRGASAILGTFNLSGCEIYTTCEPCPMCLGAIYWARIEGGYYACSKEDAAAAGFDDMAIYQEIAVLPVERRIAMTRMMGTAGKVIFEDWDGYDKRTEY